MRWMLVVLAAVLVVGCSRKQARPEELHYQSSLGKTDVTVDSSGNSHVVVTGKKGEKNTYTSTGAFDLKELGIEVPPGAKPLDMPNGLAKIETPTGSSYSAILTTPDRPEVVAAFYKTRLDKPIVTLLGTAAQVQGKSVTGDDVSVSARVLEERGVTEISVTVVRRKAK